MLIKILLVIAILIQTVATAYALKLVRATKYNSVWILFIVGFSLLSVERFVQLLMASGQYVPRWWFAYLGIVISICLSIGVMYAHKLFKYIGRLNRQRQLLNKRILTAVLRTEEKARSRFSKELHDGLGPLLSSARMSLSALARDERSPEQKEIIDNTTYVIDEAIRSLREISNNLSPHVLNDFGLARRPELRIITLSMFGEESYYTRMVQAGARGFLLKDSDIGDVVEAIDTVMAGGSYFSPQLLSSLAGRMRTREDVPDEELSAREREILVAVCRGLSNQEIADELFISKRTVDKHRANILEKTGCKNTASLVVYAIRKGIVEI